MTLTSVSLEHIRHALQGGSHTLEEIWQNYAQVWQALGWSKAQLRLWLRCLPEVEVSAAETDNPSFRGSPLGSRDDLGAIVHSILEAAGKPLPVSQVMALLPGGIIATEPMIRAAVRAHPRLTQTGPLVKLA